jgi:pilus assembly protein TadC
VPVNAWAVVGALALADAGLWAAAMLSAPESRAGRRLWVHCGAGGQDREPAAEYRRRAIRRSDLRALRRALPDALDVLALCLRAGLGLHAAVAEYANSATGIAADAFRSYLGALTVGRAPDEALADLARRYPVDEMAALAAAAAQSLRIGAPLADVLEAQAGHCRTLSLHRAREGAQRLSTQLVLPLVAFIFPVVFIIGLGPVALRVGRVLGLLR